MNETNIISSHSLTSFIQSRGTNVVQNFHEMVNASNNFTTVNVNLAIVTLTELENGRWGASFLEDNASD